MYVYDTKEYKLEYCITIPGLQPSIYNDLTEWADHNCLFVSDFGAKIIHKIEPNGDESKVTKFIDVPYEPKGLSITPDGNLLVACNLNKLAEYDAKTGEKKCEVDLTTLFQMPEACAAYDVNPLHATKRADGEYVVCHGSGVRIMKADGYTRRCYGGMWGPGEKDQ